MKIFKLFVSISLILTISLVNSFAAISVSDGSAFVTKAEFAADLNNLSNRMSSLENSLDAKIDSLVSSYLSRNGIWNGEKQEVSSTQSWNVGIASLTLKSNNASFSDKVIDTVIIPKTTKAGLFSGFIYFTDGHSNKNTNESRWGYRVNVKEKYNYFSDSGMVLSVGLDETKEGETVSNHKSSNIVGSATAVLRDSSDILAGIMVFSLPSSEVLLPQSFFVSKGSKISIVVYLDVHIVNANSISSIGHSVEVGIKDSFHIY